VISPTKRSGKSTLLQCFGAIVAKPVVAASISAAALFRIVEKYKPTLLLDEADTFLNDKNRDELRGVINSGHTRNTAFAIRCDDKFEPQQYSTFCPKVIAMIGHPKDTTMDRCIPLEMKRAEPGTQLEYLRADRLAQAGAAISAKALRFAVDNKKALAGADPQIPDEITNARARDNWRPLLAIADLCSGEWSERARKAAKELSGSNSLGDETLSEALLSDIREIFKEKKTDRVFSKDLVEVLCDTLDRPWSEANNHSPITANWLAHKLKPFHIHPKTIRIDETTSKGYTLMDFKDAFARYLPEEDCKGFRP
jgi:putative DNA primase/helicase